MNIGKWFKNIRFMGKLLIGYVIFAILPMIVVTVYNNKKTTGILQEESYRNVHQSLGQIGQNIDSSLKTYEIVMDTLYTNQMFNGYLVKDYTNSGYWEMFHYIDTLLTSLRLVESNITNIRVYSSNSTLPSDNYYFYSEKEFDEEWISSSITNKGNPQVAGILTQNNKKYVVMMRLLNYFYYSSTRNNLVVLIDGTSFNEQIQITNPDQEAYLVSSRGQILASSKKEKVGSSMDGVAKEWQTILNGQNVELSIDGISKVCASRDGLYGTKLIMMVNQESLVKATKEVTKDIVTIFFITSIGMLLAAYLYSRWLSERVYKVVYAAKKLGDGEFDYVLKDMGKDEIGIIAQAINVLNEEIQELIADNYDKKLKIKSSEMNLLQEQINPHFLYNALSVISSMALKEGGKDTMQGVKYLSDFYRMSLNKGSQVISVWDELELLKNYMKIQLLRFEDTVEISYDVNRRAIPFRTLKLLLQPLVENSIHHGRRDEGQVLHIGVTVTLTKERLIFEVKDDGVGIEPEKLLLLKKELRDSKEGYGLKNVDIRVKLHYGSQYGVRITSSYGSGTCVKVELPQIFS